MTSKIHWIGPPRAIKTWHRSYSQNRTNETRAIFGGRPLLWLLPTTIPRLITKMPHSIQIIIYLLMLLLCKRKAASWTLKLSDRRWKIIWSHLKPVLFQEKTGIDLSMSFSNNWTYTSTINWFTLDKLSLFLIQSMTFQLKIQIL